MSRPVFEPTTQRQVRRLGFSADQLFRRPAPASAGGVMPVVYCEIDGQTFFDGNYNSLTYLLGEFYSSAYGAATSINMVNDDGTFLIGPLSSPEGLWITKHGLYAYDAGVNFHDVGGLPAANIQIWFEFGPARLPVSINSPIQDVVESVYVTNGEQDLTARISGIVLLRPTTNPETMSESANGLSIQVVVDTNDLDVSQGWATISLLSEIDV